MTLTLEHAALPAITSRFKRSDLMRLCAGAPQGNFVELGVYQGGTAWLFYQIAQQRGVKLHLFDTFEGIPERTAIDLLNVGDLATPDLSRIREIMPDALFHIGVFPQTLTAEVKGLSFIHIDCDQYVTCAAAILFLWPRLVPGGIIAFDDYDFPGIRKAVDNAFPHHLKCAESGIVYAIKEERNTL